MTYTSKQAKRTKLSMSERLSPDKIASDRSAIFSKGGAVQRAYTKNIGDILNKNVEPKNKIQDTLEKVYKRIQDLQAGKLRK
jgi:hypothetical protein